MPTDRRKEGPDRTDYLEGLAEPLQQVDRTYVRHRGRRLIYFAGCDYFRLASHPDVLAAVRRGLETSGLNTAASRKTTGNHAIYGQLEAALARFFRAGSATLVSNGYVTSLCAAQALAGDVTHALLDERAHGCLVDAAALLSCPALRFRHRDPADLARAVAEAGPGSRLLLMTDGLFSHSGEVAPVDRYLEVLPRNATVLVDDAHGAGVLGRRGRGTPEFLGLAPGRVLQTITLSKAFGVYGGAILGSREFRARLIERSRYFVGNTPLPLPLAHGALAALRLVASDSQPRRRLAINTAFVKAALREGGVPVQDGPGPIIPLHPRSEAHARQVSRALLRAGIHPPLIRYQGGPGNTAYFRLVLSSEHDGPQLDALVQSLVRAWPDRAPSRTGSRARPRLG